MKTELTRGSLIVSLLLLAVVGLGLALIIFGIIASLVGNWHVLWWGLLAVPCMAVGQIQYHLFLAWMQQERERDNASRGTIKRPKILE